MDEYKIYKASITINHERANGVITLDVEASDESDASEIAWDILSSNYVVINMEAK